MILPVTYYHAKEESLNVITHFIGFLLSIAALVLLVAFAGMYGSPRHIVSFSIYGGSLVTLYLASTLYHSARRKKLRRKLNILDHAAIYLLIAGTYTPFTLITLSGSLGWTLFGVVWGLALAGIGLKLFFTGRYDRISTVGYVLLGWVAVVALKPLIAALSPEGSLYLLAGGISYTIGAVFYSLRKVPYNHSIFHVWVLLGSVFHFISIFFFVR